MERLTFKISINATCEKVWNILWSDDTYREWTSIFSPGSRAETDWREGSKILFLNADNEGMVSRIASKKENEFMSFEHLGEINKGVEDTESERVKKWAGSTENYTLNTVDGQMELTVDVDVTDDFKDYFAETWPKALEKLKSMAERSEKVAS